MTTLTIETKLGDFILEYFEDIQISESIKELLKQHFYMEPDCRDLIPLVAEVSICNAGRNPEDFKALAELALNVNIQGPEDEEIQNRLKNGSQFQHGIAIAWCSDEIPSEMIEPWIAKAINGPKHCRTFKDIRRLVDTMFFRRSFQARAIIQIKNRETNHGRPNNSKGAAQRSATSIG